MVHLGRQLPVNFPGAVSGPVVPELVDLCKAAPRLGPVGQNLELSQAGQLLRRLGAGRDLFARYRDEVLPKCTPSAWAAEEEILFRALTQG